MKFLDLCLYFEKEKVIVFGDVHMGYEQAMHNKGFAVPKIQYQKTILKLEKIFNNIKIKTVVINGDLKHEFGKILKDEWKYINGLILFLKKYCNKIILIEGNHDKILYPIAIKNKVRTALNVLVNDTLICHGDSVHEEAKLKNIKRIIIGHEHPAVIIKEYPREEKFKCYLIGKYNRKELVVMPSFNVVTEGTDILEGKFLSPFIKNIEEFKIKVVGKGKIYDFGTVKEIRKLNS